MLSLIIRSISTVAIGILLLVYREQAMPFIVMCVGTLFVLPALFILTFTFIPSLKHLGGPPSSAKVMSILAIGSLLLGLWMIFSPDFFVKILMLVIGVAMTIMGFTQIFSLLKLAQTVKVSPLLYIMPITILLAGVTTLLYPFETASIPFIILGISAIIGALSDIINSIFIYFTRKKLAKNTEIEITEE